jgi:hypothetical protein
LNGVERYELRAILEVGLDEARGLECEPCLAYAAGPGQGEQPSRTGPQPLADPAHLAAATDRAIRCRRQRAAPVDGRRDRRTRRLEGRVVHQDRLVQLMKFISRLDSELLDKHIAGMPVGLQRVRLAAAAI